MNCDIIFEKYNYIIKKIKSTELDLKFSNDSPILKSYIKEDINKLIFEKNLIIKEFKICQEKLSN